MTNGPWLAGSSLPLKGVCQFKWLYFLLHKCYGCCISEWHISNNVNQSSCRQFDKLFFFFFNVYAWKQKESWDKDYRFLEGRYQAGLFQLALCLNYYNSNAVKQKFKAGARCLHSRTRTRAGAGKQLLYTHYKSTRVCLSSFPWEKKEKQTKKKAPLTSTSCFYAV